MHGAAKPLPPPASNLSNFSSWKRCLTKASLQLSAEDHQHFHKQINPFNICGRWEVVVPWLLLSGLAWPGSAHWICPAPASLTPAAVPPHLPRRQHLPWANRQTLSHFSWSLCHPEGSRWAQEVGRLGCHCQPASCQHMKGAELWNSCSKVQALHHYSTQANLCLGSNCDTQGALMACAAQHTQTRLPGPHRGSPGLSLVLWWPRGVWSQFW